MKKTLKFFGLLAMAAIAFSCSKDEARDNNENPGTEVVPGDLDPTKYLVSFGATIEYVKTSASVDLTTGDCSFTDGDEVLVVAGTESAVYVYSASDDNFTPKADAVSLAADVKAYYPAAKFSSSAGTVTFTMPEATVENPGTLAPMCAVVTGGVASFKNLGAILQVNLTGSEPVTAVELVASAPIAGSSVVSWSADTPEIGALSGASSVKLDFSTAIPAGTAQTLYFFLPAGITTSLDVRGIYGKTDGTNTFEPYKKISRKSALTTVRNKVITITKTLEGFFAAGDGSESAPYQIASADDFKAVATLANATADLDGNGFSTTAGRTFFGSAGVHYVQTGDVNTNGPITPIGNETTPFAGTYDGGDYTLWNFVINASVDNTGIFGYLDRGTIKNLNVSGTISSTANQVGGIVGYMAGGTIESCSFTGTVIGSAQVGGIVGDAGLQSSLSADNICKITACRVNAVIVKADLNGASNVGGIAGRIRHSVIINSCYAKGNVEGAGYNIGGLVGQMMVNVANAVGRSYMFDCLANMNVTATRPAGQNVRLGGAVGYLLNNSSNTTSTAPYVGVDNCVVAPVTITADGNNVGGFVGALKGNTADATDDLRSRLRLRNNCTFVSSVPGNNGFMGTREDGQMILQYNYCTLSTDAFFELAAANLPAGVTRQNCGRSRTYSGYATTLCNTFNANTSYNLNINSVSYTSGLGWTTKDGVEYIIPGALADLGEDYYK